MNPPIKKGLSAFVEGFTLPLEGYRFMRANPSLWRFAWLPIVLNSLLTMAVLAGLVFVAIKFNAWLFGWVGEGWFWSIVQGVAWVGLGVLFLGIGVALALVLGMIFFGYFYGKLAHAVELKIGTRPEELTELSVMSEVVESISALFELIIVNVSLLLVHLLPGIGSFLGGAATWYYDSYIFGSEFLDYGMVLRGMKRKERRAFTKRFRLHTLGLGSSVMVFNFVPILGAAVLTTAVVGGVFLRQRLHRSEVI